MCGLTGFAGAGDEHTLNRMCKTLVHRGPDDRQILVEESGDLSLGFGFQRLIILDTLGGRQPMTSTDGSVTVLFNGEIYNAPDLRRELEAEGHHFESSYSDTEVLVHGYKEWGYDLPKRLNGMFAFAILDRPGGKFFLARDRLGKKPLFYSQTEEGFVFASELRAIFPYLMEQPKIDRKSLKRYFALGYIPAPDTLYQGIHKLPGGMSLTYSLLNRQLVTSRYWLHKRGNFGPPPGTADDWAHEFMEILDRAVQRRLVSDVPIGLFLSGGLDSTTLVSLACRHLDPAQIQTHCIGFEETSFDESDYAKSAARHYGTDHRTTMLDMSLARDMVPSVLGAMDEPIADPSLLPTHLLCREARKNMTVALAGDGGDELFGGYDTFSALRLAKAYHTLVPTPLRRAFASAAHGLPVSDKNMSLDFKLRRSLTGLCHPAALWHPIWLAPASPYELERMFGEKIELEEIYGDVIADWNDVISEKFGDKALDFYTTYYLGANLLTKMDRASMSSSLEVRSPFLDDEVMDYSATLPYDVKVRSGERKWILKRATDGMVPKNIRKRKKKGFGIPVSAWLKEMASPSADISDELGLDSDYLGECRSRHITGKADHRGLLWSWLAVAACHESGAPEIAT